jgi:hypothetical protein
MIHPFTRHFFDLALPILVLVRREARKVTFRSFRELAGNVEHAGMLSEEEAGRLLTEHAASWQPATFGRRPIPGGYLAPRLGGRVFEEMGGVCLDLDGMLGKGEWSDHASWLFPLDRQGAPGAPVNRHVVTRETKARTPRHLESAGQNCALQIYVPFAACDFDDCSFSVALHPRFGLVGNLDPGVEVTYRDVLAGMHKPFPSVVLSAKSVDVAPDALASVSVRLVDGHGAAITDADAEIYLQQTGGYLPKQRVTTQRGEATFRVGALGLLPGDSFRVKVGFRHVTGLAELLVRVV